MHNAVNRIIELNKTVFQRSFRPVNNNKTTHKFIIFMNKNIIILVNENK
jgi:hypothetical protein